jgi:Flp pilus assembly protein TadG
MRVIGDDEQGSVTVLIIGFTAIAMALIVVGIDVSKVVLAERALSSAADAAAVDAAQGVDTDRIYDGPDLRCGEALPLDPDRAAAMAQESIAQRSPDLARAFRHLDPPVTTVEGRTVTVAMRGEVEVPFGRILGFLGIANDGGAVPVRDTASATSPVAGGATACGYTFYTPKVYD